MAGPTGRRAGLCLIAYNKSLDASGRSVFRKIIGPAMVD